MSEITITSENISRFNKRLQKALMKEFGKEIPLHVASLLLANALGASNEHQLKEKLKQEETNSDNPYEKKAKQLDQDLENFKKETKLNISLEYTGNDFCIRITGNSVKHNYPESFAIFFNDHAHPTMYLDKELSRIKHSKEDKEFFINLANKYFSGNSEENRFLGSVLADYKWIEKDSYYRP